MLLCDKCLVGYGMTLKISFQGKWTDFVDNINFNDSYFYFAWKKCKFHFNGFGQGSALYDCLPKWKKKRKFTVML